MYPYSETYTPADDDTDALLDGSAGAGPFVPLVAGPGDGLGHLISITTTGGVNLSGLTFIVTGTDADGIPETEAIVGPNNTTVYGAKYFKTVTGVTVSATTGADAFDMGWKDECVTPTFPMNWRQVDFQATFGIDISGTINFTQQNCDQDIRSVTNPANDLKWWDDAVVASKTADTQGNYAYPVTATRTKVNSSTAGATFTQMILQGR